MILKSPSRIFSPTHTALAVFSVLFALGLAAQAAAACAPAPPGLVSWWRAENNATDSAGGNPGKMAGHTAYAAGVGRAFEFDGDEDLIMVGSANNLHLQNLTIEAWIKRASTNVTSFGSGGSACIFGYGDGAYNFYLGGNTHLYFGKLGTIALPSAGTITDTSFHHVAMTKSGSTVIFYIDGVADSVINFPYGFEFLTPAAIGARPDNQDNSFYGRIDELAVYNRALTPAEILAIYNAADLGKCARPAGVATAAASANRGLTETKPSATTPGPPESFDALRASFTSEPGRIWFTRISRQPEGHARMQFVVALDRAYRIEASTNLLDWEAIGGATQLPHGEFQFEDGNAAQFPHRYYRVVTP